MGRANGSALDMIQTQWFPSVLHGSGIEKHIPRIEHTC